MKRNVERREETKQPLKLCFITDDRYSLITGVAIASLKLNKAKESRYAVYILCDKVSAENKRRFLSYSSEDFSIILKDVNGYEEYHGSLKIEHISATPTSLYKFMIADILAEIDEILYVDGDVLFKKDLASLFAVDLTGYYAYVTPEAIGGGSEPPYNCKRLNINHKIYFQSGLMLLNLKLLREEKISEKLLYYRLNGINFLMDQDALNVVFNENVGYYEPIVFPSYYELCSKKFIGRYGGRTKRKILKKALVIHYATKLKPWTIKIRGATKTYLKYHKKSAFADIPLKPMSYTKQWFYKLYDKIYGGPVYKIIHKLRGKK